MIRFGGWDKMSTEWRVLPKFTWTRKVILWLIWMGNTNICVLRAQNQCTTGNKVDVLGIWILPSWFIEGFLPLSFQDIFMKVWQLEYNIFSTKGLNLMSYMLLLSMILSHLPPLSPSIFVPVSVFSLGCISWHPKTNDPAVNIWKKDKATEAICYSRLDKWVID